MIGVMYGEPWNCPVDWVAVDHEPRITFKVNLDPPVDLRDFRLDPGFIVIVEEPPRQGWWDHVHDFLLMLCCPSPPLSLFRTVKCPKPSPPPAT